MSSCISLLITSLSSWLHHHISPTCWENLFRQEQFKRFVIDHILTQEKKVELFQSVLVWEWMTASDQHCSHINTDETQLDWRVDVQDSLTEVADDLLTPLSLPPGQSMCCGRWAGGPEGLSGPPEADAPCGGGAEDPPPSSSAAPLPHPVPPARAWAPRLVRDWVSFVLHQPLRRRSHTH